MEHEEPIYYITKRIDKDIVVNGMILKKGYYRINYNISGKPFDHVAQYSEDPYGKWKDTDLYKDIGEFNELFDKIEPAPMTMEKMAYCETITYRGYTIPIFADDYGQCFYGIIDNKCISFGSYNPDYEGEVKDFVDFELDEKPKLMKAKLEKEKKQ